MTGLFNICWDFLSQLGQCDGIGGSEYHRVFAEYQQADFQTGITAFILRRANISATGEEPDVAAFLSEDFDDDKGS